MTCGHCDAVMNKDGTIKRRRKRPKKRSKR